MITQDQADQIVHQILCGELLPVSTHWRDVWGTGDLEISIIERGLSALEALLAKDTICVLHGWIDQAVLEIIMFGTVAGLHGRVRTYRADQGGNTGILALYGERVLLLEFSYERGGAALVEYQPAQKVEGGKAAVRLAPPLAVRGTAG